MLVLLLVPVGRQRIHVGPGELLADVGGAGKRAQGVNLGSLNRVHVLLETLVE